MPPIVDCHQRSHLDRLFFPGDSHSRNKSHRDLISCICKGIIVSPEYFAKKLNKDEKRMLERHEESFDEFLADEGVSYFHDSFSLIYAAFQDHFEDREFDRLAVPLARYFLAITNTQCLVDQFLPIKACDFIDKCLDLSEKEQMSMDILHEADDQGVRRSLIELVKVSCENTENGTIVSRAIAEMLEGMSTKARKIFEDSVAQSSVPDLPQPAPADYSSGVAMFVTKTGGKFRLFPTFRNCGKSGRCGDRTCTKPSWDQQDCKRWQWSSDGNITFMCSKSGCVLGTYFLDAAEGRSSATAGIYCYFPRWDDRDRTIVCDTPCMHSIYAGNRLPFYFRRTQWVCDRFHIPPHTCKLIFNPDDFSYLDGVNLSLVEQWHSLVDGLSVSLQRMTLDHAMFFLLLLQYDRYSKLARRAGVPEKDMCWPDDITSPLDVPSLVRDVPISGPSIECTEEDESPDEFFRTYDSCEKESDCDNDEGDL